MKAYIITEPELGACIKFAKYNVVARREGALELDAEFESVECRRAPEFDKYSSEKMVPMQDLIARGWSFECWGCSTTVYEDAEDDEGNPLELYYPDDNRVYCSLQCCSEQIERKNEEKRREREVTDQALKKWPGIQITHTNGYMDPPLVYFRFPGCKFRAEWRLGQIFVSISAVDADAWKKFAESIKATRVANEN